MIVLWAGIKDHLLGELVDYDQDSVKTQKDNGSFSMKSIEMEFHGCSELGSCFEGIHRVCDIMTWIAYK